MKLDMESVVARKESWNRQVFGGRAAGKTMFHRQANRYRDVTGADHLPDEAWHLYLPRPDLAAALLDQLCEEALRQHTVVRRHVSARLDGGAWWVWLNGSEVSHRCVEFVGAPVAGVPWWGWCRMHVPDGRGRMRVDEDGGLAEDVRAGVVIWRRRGAMDDEEIERRLPRALEVIGKLWDHDRASRWLGGLERGHGDPEVVARNERFREYLDKVAEGSYTDE